MIQLLVELHRLNPSCPNKSMDMAELRKEIIKLRRLKNSGRDPSPNKIEEAVSPHGAGVQSQRGIDPPALDGSPSSNSLKRQSIANHQSRRRHDEEAVRQGNPDPNAIVVPPTPTLPRSSNEEPQAQAAVNDAAAAATTSEEGKHDAVVLDLILAGQKQTSDMLKTQNEANKLQKDENSQRKKEVDHLIGENSQRKEEIDHLIGENAQRKEETAQCKNEIEHLSSEVAEMKGTRNNDQKNIAMTAGLAQKAMLTAQRGNKQKQERYSDPPCFTPHSRRRLEYNGDGDGDDDNGVGE